MTYRGGEGAHGPAVRSLASRHLSSPAVDGWNAVAGAVELAGAWALRSNDLPIIVYTAYDLSYETRMRLATCLSVAWKFERQLCSHFPRRFHDTEPNLVCMGGGTLHPIRDDLLGRRCHGALDAVRGG